MIQIKGFDQSNKLVLNLTTNDLKHGLIVIHAEIHQCGNPYHIVRFDLWDWSGFALRINNGEIA